MRTSTTNRIGILDASKNLDASQRALAAKVGQVISLRSKQASANEPSVLLSLQNVGTKRSQRSLVLERQAEETISPQESTFDSDSHGSSGTYTGSESVPILSGELIRDNADAERTLLLARKKILSEASAAMMVQAQALPRIMLSLLG